MRCKALIRDRADTMTPTPFMNRWQLIIGNFSARLGRAVQKSAHQYEMKTRQHCKTPWTHNCDRQLHGPARRRHHRLASSLCPGPLLHQSLTPSPQVLQDSKLGGLVRCYGKIRKILSGVHPDLQDNGNREKGEARSFSQSVPMFDASSCKL
jgi:hypothetical protein